MAGMAYGMENREQVFGQKALGDEAGHQVKKKAWKLKIIEENRCTNRRMHMIVTNVQEKISR